jgi:hypothetical protein
MHIHSRRKGLGDWREDEMVGGWVMWVMYDIWTVEPISCTYIVEDRVNLTYNNSLYGVYHDHDLVDPAVHGVRVRAHVQ